VLYLLSGYTIWAILVYDVLSMFLFTTLALYVIWTFHRRPAWMNFLILTP
ncbi:MAG: hypothetical protein GWM98_24795, partial [Nitrospinaceae bacterium]|nr:hypothetical protein [Nitrospinaceae bacterium]NIR57095.1 hypothetical protein [Nitrospinaceae bacterium]NIS87536.1 hypothetical protein [Nitrospinaceae bacterium]NIT84406.1 hypothetical protein [Nitrospinaceae bacterium]NIU46593.1 hypothetical protein [Nitrospinaceae bacterium]